MTKTGSSAALSASRRADDLRRSVDVGAANTPDDAETPSDVDVDSESGEEDEVEADNDAGTATEGPEAELGGTPQVCGSHATEARRQVRGLQL